MDLRLFSGTKLRTKIDTIDFMKNCSKVFLILVALISISTLIGCNSSVSSASSEEPPFTLAGTYTGEVLGDTDTFVINQNKSFLWSKISGTQFKGNVTYDGNSTVVINMTHQNNGSGWTASSSSFSATYSNNTITISMNGNTFVFTKQ